jgi:hypothetical protein
MDEEPRMTALLTITFTDGTTKELDLGSACVEINLPPESRQSIAVNQTHKGEFRLSFTKPLMEGKRFQKIVIEKMPTQPEKK